jgi:hypothetical protein
VELAKRFGEKDSPPFVNGVLDALNRTIRPFEAKERKDRPAPAEGAEAAPKGRKNKE